MDSMEESGVTPGIPHYTMLIQVYSHQRDVDNTIQVAETIVKKVSYRIYFVRLR
jgi:hypothetical protein